MLFTFGKVFIFHRLTIFFVVYTLVINARRITFIIILCRFNLQFTLFSLDTQLVIAESLTVRAFSFFTNKSYI